MINPVQQDAYTNAVRPTETKAIEAVDQPRARQTGDTALFSSEAAMISSMFADLGVDYSPGRGVTLDQLEAGLGRTQNEFEDRATVLFLENGITLEPPVELTTDSLGAVRVKGDHPDKERIEQLFADNPDLANDFRKVGGLTGLVEAGNEYLEFSKAYAKDPYAAVARYGHLFDAINDAPFSLILGATKDA